MFILINSLIIVSRIKKNSKETLGKKVIYEEGKSKSKHHLFLEMSQQNTTLITRNILFQVSNSLK